MTIELQAPTAPITPAMPLPQNQKRGGRRTGAGRRKVEIRLRDGQVVPVTIDPTGDGTPVLHHIAIRFQDGAWRAFLEPAGDAPVLMITESAVYQHE